MPVTFSSYLQMIRDEKNLTQQHLLELLVKSNDAFSKLDLTTLSRWERGVTTPKLEKQLLVARLLDSDVAMLINPDVHIPKTKLHMVDKVRYKTLNPYSADKTLFKMTTFTSLKEEASLCETLEVFHNDYLDIDIKKNVLADKPICMNAFFDQKGELIGHLLYGYVPIETPSKRINPNNLSDCPFIELESINNHKDAKLCIISAYSSLSIPRMVIILTILSILRQNSHLKAAYINCHDQDAFNLYDANTDCRIITKGKTLPFGGVKVFGHRYKYVQLQISSESILASKVVSGLIPFTDEYIDDLLE